MRNIVVCLLVLLLGACETTFGPAETSPQRAYRLTGEYGYLAIPAANYVNSPDANEEVVEQIQLAGKTLYASYQGVKGSLASGEDLLSSAVAGFGEALGTFSIAVIGEYDIPDVDSDDILARGVVLGKVGAKSIASMRRWRKAIKADLEAMEATGRDPTDEEWADADEFVSKLHERIHNPS